jgi:hypothetical protein
VRHGAGRGGFLCALGVRLVVVDASSHTAVGVGPVWRHPILTSVVCDLTVHAASQALYARHGYHLPPPQFRVAVNQQMRDLQEGVPTAIPTPTDAQLRMARLYLKWCKKHKNILYLQKLVRARACV